MNIYQFKVSGKAVPKARPRIGRGGHTYTPKTTQEYERRVRDAFNCAFPNHKPIQNPVRISIQECRPMPKSWSFKQKYRMHGEPVASKADLDNIIKAVLDSLNGIAFRDDSQVWNLQASKLWDYDGSVTVTIYESDIGWETDVKIPADSFLNKTLHLKSEG